MVTTNKIGGSGITKNAELRGLSTDTKPLEVPNGSIFTEIDTSNQYMFDKENENWFKMKSQSGGGSVSDVDASDVNYRGSNVKEALDDLSDRNASNILYDDYSTIYSAMGDIDELETENKNLVDAINEVNNKPSGIVPSVDYNGLDPNAVPTKIGEIYPNIDLYKLSFYIYGRKTNTTYTIEGGTYDFFDKAIGFIGGFAWEDGSYRRATPIVITCSNNNVIINYVNTQIGYQTHNLHHTIYFLVNTLNALDLEDEFEETEVNTNDNGE